MPEGTDKNTAELARKALEWCERNDGGRMYADDRDEDHPQMVILWDNGGQDELGHFDGDHIEDLELICDLVNWAVEQLVPSETHYGTRTYAADSEN
ncbi:hypothetical protein OG874_00305 [Nocardia sp. NBC_00565]|uniref:hypothetical protein n=1 Tax=Nocardia sp. NBC_00565 TaxID=2975993 RepID=UPI002E822998|nr:hypothetical protein [Nocardia sp. NBC_00565]WUC03696.1 hypothetical protein OG874_00305 [Nocardia sp. NBC_00565]